MTGISWRAVDLLCQMLEPDERAAVRGDLTESGETGGRALVGVLGLVLRRQAALWRVWQPWAVLVGIAVPLGWSLGLVSWDLSHRSANHILSYARQWNNPIIREDFPGFAETTLISWLSVSCVSWISGFGLGFMSRRTVPINGALYGSAMLLGYVANPHLLTGTHYWTPASGFTPYYGLFLTVLAVVVVLPSVLGIRQGLRLATHRPFIQTALRAATIGILVMFAIRAGLGIFWRVTGAFTHPPILDLLSSVVRIGMYWPMVYLVVSAVARCRRPRGAAEIAGL